MLLVKTEESSLRLSSGPIRSAPAGDGRAEQGQLQRRGFADALRASADLFTAQIEIHSVNDGDFVNGSRRRGVSCLR